MAKPRRPFANVFHLQPDRGFELFARFCRLLQADSFTARNGTAAFGYPRQHGLNSGRKPLAIRYRLRTQTTGDGPFESNLVGVMFQRPVTSQVVGAGAVVRLVRARLVTFALRPLPQEAPPVLGGLTQP
jgi:hypothetical protein